MDTKWLIIAGFLVLSSLIIAGCSKAKGPSPIVEVMFSSDSGPVSPDFQSYETITITADKATLVRKGSTTDTKVEAGIWTADLDKEQTAALFAQLEAIDTSTLLREEPADPIDGGHTESYTLVYANGKTFSMLFDPGVTYRNGDLVVEPVAAFLQAVTWVED